MSAPILAPGAPGHDGPRWVQVLWYPQSMPADWTSSTFAEAKEEREYLAMTPKPEGFITILEASGILDLTPHTVRKIVAVKGVETRKWKSPDYINPVTVVLLTDILAYNMTNRRRYNG